MKVYIDGKEVKVLNDVKIEVEAPTIFGGITDESTLDLTFTHEGMIVDIWEIVETDNGKTDTVNTCTDSGTYEEWVQNVFFEGRVDCKCYK